MNSPPPEDKPSYVEDFFPGYFALVMATGIVSLAMHFEGIPWSPGAAPLAECNFLRRPLGHHRSSNSLVQIRVDR